MRSILPAGAEVYNNTSRTLEVIGVAEDIERSGLYQPLRPRLYQMDREMQAREMRQLSAAPDWVVGSVHAVTEEGSLLIASASGSQLCPIASGAGHVILVIGGQKIVADVGTGLRIGEMNRLDRMRLRQHEQIVIAAQIAWPVGETFAAEIRFAEFMRLDHRAHGTVEHENALSGGGTKFVMAIERGHFGHQATFVSACGRRPSRWQIA